MIIEIQHETRLTYSHSVSEWLAELRVEPVSDIHQSCQTFNLSITGSPAVFRYTDGFGNRVHHFNLLRPAEEVQALAASVVETHPRPIHWEGSKSVWPLEPENLPLGTLDFLRMQGPVAPTAKLNPILETLKPEPETRLADYIRRVCAWIHDTYDYARAVTSASSPIDDLLSTGKGVCQDFAHLMIAVLRSYQIPARYISGYIHRPNEESQSHAWCEAWIPDLGWVGLDPTNNSEITDHFVKVAVGRNFTDVPPNKGVYRGTGEETIRARVETRELARQPTLSWQEQLPKLHVPLTVVLAHLKRELTDQEEVEQEQQQQQ